MIDFLRVHLCWLLWLQIWLSWYSSHKYISVLQSAGLVLVHVHSRWVISSSGKDNSSPLILNDMNLQITPDMPLWQFYLFRWVEIILLRWLLHLHIVTTPVLREHNSYTSSKSTMQKYALKFFQHLFNQIELVWLKVLTLQSGTIIN